MNFGRSTKGIVARINKVCDFIETWGGCIMNAREGTLDIHAWICK